jgi:hypothetical protein
MRGGNRHRVIVDGTVRADVTILAARRVVRSLLRDTGVRREVADAALRHHLREWAAVEARAGRLVPEKAPPSLLLPVNSTQLKAALRAHAGDGGANSAGHPERLTNT